MTNSQVIDPSMIVLGTMRMLEHNKSVEEWSSLFAEFFFKGIRKIHSSSEYESFPLYCKVLAEIKVQYPQVVFEHIVKLASPNFDEKGLTENAIEEKIDEYCEALGCDIINTIQWMWRADLKNEKTRLTRFIDQATNLQIQIENLKQRGKIKSFCCFPYTPEFAFSALQYSFIDGLLIYRNPLENEYSDVLDRCTEQHKFAYAIRPLAAKKALSGSDAGSLISYALNHESIIGTVVSLSNNKHLDEILKAHV